MYPQYNMRSGNKLTLYNKMAWISIKYNAFIATAGQTTTYQSNLIYAPCIILYDWICYHNKIVQ